MKNIVFFSILMLSVFPLLAQQPVVIASSDYEPYTSSQKGGSGAMIDIIREAFALQSRTTVFEFVPWKRAELAVKEGSAFAAVPYFKTEERVQSYDFSDPVILSYNRFYFDKRVFPRGFSWEKLEDFQGFRMGGILGYWYIPEWKKAGLQVEEVTSDIQNIRKLLARRIDFLVLDEMVAQRFFTEEIPLEKTFLAMAEKPESTAPFHLLVSRTYPQANILVTEFNKGLEILKNTGAYSRILKAYGMPDTYSVP